MEALEAGSPKHSKCWVKGPSLLGIWEIRTKSDLGMKAIMLGTLEVQEHVISLWGHVGVRCREKLGRGLEVLQPWLSLLKAIILGTMEVHEALRDLEPQ